MPTLTSEYRDAAERPGTVARQRSGGGIDQTVVEQAPEANGARWKVGARAMKHPSTDAESGYTTNQVANLDGEIGLHCGCRCLIDRKLLIILKPRSLGWKEWQ